VAGQCTAQLREGDSFSLAPSERQTRALSPSKNPAARLCRARLRLPPQEPYRCPLGIDLADARRSSCLGQRSVTSRCLARNIDARGVGRSFLGAPCCRTYSWLATSVPWIGAIRRAILFIISKHKSDSIELSELAGVRSDASKASGASKRECRLGSITDIASCPGHVRSASIKRISIKQVGFVSSFSICSAPFPCSSKINPCFVGKNPCSVE